MMVFQSLYELLTIVLFRFRLLPRVWAILLILVNAGSLLFLDTHYGQAALVAVTVGVVIMTIIHMRVGFVRLLGIGHLLWIPMLPWMISQLPTVNHDSSLYLWMVVLIGFNSVSLVIDTIDVVRFLRGEREPHYRLHPEATE